MNWFKGLFRRRAHVWFRVMRQGQYAKTPSIGGAYRSARAAHDALGTWRALGDNAWLERSDDLGKTWHRVNDDGTKEGA